MLEDESKFDIYSLEYSTRTKTSTLRRFTLDFNKIESLISAYADTIRERIVIYSV
jgi:hypothetical protein